MNILHRELAPISEQAWRLLDGDTKSALTEHMVARSVVDFDGPHGPQYAALNLGRIQLSELGDGAFGGLRAVRPLFELRLPFSLERSDLDAAERGAPALRSSAARQAARRLAELEDRIIFEGLDAAGISGMARNSEHEPIPLGPDPASSVDAIVRALLALDEAAVGGPYAVVLAADRYRQLGASVDSYPLLRQISQITGGPVLRSRALQGGLVLSLRGGDFKLSVGQDAALAYTSHDANCVKLYLIESFTFEVSSPEAVVRLSD